MYLGDSMVKVFKLGQRWGKIQGFVGGLTEKSMDDWTTASKLAKTVRGLVNRYEYFIQPNLEKFNDKADYKEIFGIGESICDTLEMTLATRKRIAETDAKVDQYGKKVGETVVE